MIEQLEHLETMADLPNVELRILPADGRAICARGDFELLIYMEMYEYLYGVALSPEDSVQRIHEIADSYRQQL